MPSHTIRHEAAQLAAHVAQDLILNNPNDRGRIDPAAAADVFLAHPHVHSDRHTYRDIAPHAQRWAIRLAIGDPELGVAGVLDHLFGDAGAPKGWNIAAISEQFRRRDSAQRRIDDAELQLAHARRAQDALTTMSVAVTLPDPPPLLQRGEHVTLDEDSLAGRSDRELLELCLLAGDTHRQHLIATQQAIHAAYHDRATELAQVGLTVERLRDRLAELRLTRTRAEHALERIRDAGRCHPLDDDEPVTDELRYLHADPTLRGLDRETWDEAITRAGGTPACLTYRVRRYLNAQELCWLFGVERATIAAWRRGEGKSTLGRAMGRATWKSAGTKLHFVDADTLPAELLLPIQKSELERLLAAPMGRHHGGRCRTDDELDAQP